MNNFSVIKIAYSLGCIEMINLRELIVDKIGVRMKFYRKMIELWLMHIAWAILNISTFGLFDIMFTRGRRSCRSLPCGCLRQRHRYYRSRRSHRMI